MKKLGRNLLVYLIIFSVVIGIASFYKTGLNNQATYKEVAFSTFVQYASDERIAEVVIDDITLKAKLTDGTYVYTYAPSSIEIMWLDEQYLLPQAEEGKLKYTAPKPTSGNFLLNVLPNILMIGAMIFLLFMMMNQGGNGKAFQFGKSRARMVKGDKSVTFKDVAGLEEEKLELEEVVDFLKNPRKYKELGARIPKGMLLVGPPGTGKTYIAKAAAGEAGVPFFTISGSDFVEMFVGVGASRVRDLFEQAKKNSPCIIFIDEIDAVGRKRGAGIGGGHDEREQTLNQLLVEMDGFEENSGIIVLAATNRPDVLDNALLRPGRFDRQVVIGLPDVKGREDIIKIHSKNKPLAEDVTPATIAKRTSGFTPADLENLLNEAALITARRNGRFIRMEEIEEATTKVMAGPAKKSRVITEKERRLTAIHEAGHAVLTRSLPDTPPVHQVTIIPRGMAGGFTMYLPEEDNFFETKRQMFNFIITCLGGRVAEQLKLDDISTGASNDIQKATEIARDMVTKYGFSEKLGTVNYAGAQEVFLGNDLTQHKNYSEETAQEIDEEIRKIINEAYDIATKTLKEKNDILEAVADALLKVETLDQEQFEAIYTGKMTPDELKADVDKKAEEKKIANEAEAKEAERLRKEADEKEAAELKKFDSNYMANDDQERKGEPEDKEQ